MVGLLYIHSHSTPPLYMYLLLSYRASLCSYEMHLSAANSPNKVWPSMLQMLLLHTVFCVCTGALCHLLILRGGPMETPSKEYSPLSNQGNWSVHYSLIVIVHTFIVHYIWLSSPPPSLSPLPVPNREPHRIYQCVNSGCITVYHKRLNL